MNHFHYSRNPKKIKIKNKKKLSKLKKLKNSKNKKNSRSPQLIAIICKVSNKYRVPQVDTLLKEQS